MIKWIITDLDGTLISHNPSDYSVFVDPTTINTWNAQVDSDKYKFSIATGRHYLNVLDLMDQFKIKLPTDAFVVGMNGAQIYSCKSKQLVANHLIPKNELSQFDAMDNYLSKKFHNQYMLMGYQDTQQPIFFFDHKTELFKVWMNEMCVYENSTEEFSSQLINKFTDVDKVYKVIIVFKTSFDYEQELKELAKILPNMNFAKSADSFIEIFPKSVDKRIALEFINNKYYQIDHKSTLIFGDSFNDYPMLEWSGIGVTRKSADPGIRAICDYVIDAPASTFVGDGLELILG